MKPFNARGNNSEKGNQIIKDGCGESVETEGKQGKGGGGNIKQKK